MYARSLSTLISISAPRTLHAATRIDPAYWNFETIMRCGSSTLCDIRRCTTWAPRRINFSSAFKRTLPTTMAVLRCAATARRFQPRQGRSLDFCNIVLSRRAAPHPSDGMIGTRSYTTWDRAAKKLHTAKNHSKFVSIPGRKGIAAPLSGLDATEPQYDDSPEDEGELTPEQRHVLEKVMRGENVFFTGPAGTGKSYLLRKIIQACGGRKNERLAITAATGIAANNIGGCTLHSWAGIGLGKESVESMEEKMKKYPHYLPAVGRWFSTKTLIIDEISMIDGVLFDKLEWLARVLRGSKQVFGNIQLVLCGDFFQLPPVVGITSTKYRESRFAYQAKTWRACVGKPIILNRVFRQKDPVFINILHSMRTGHLDSKAIDMLNSLSRPVHYEDGIGPTELFATRKEVQKFNHDRLTALQGPTYVYKAIDTAGKNEYDEPIPEYIMDVILDRNVNVPKELTLKIGAQVMLLKNLVPGCLVNGTVGRVIGFTTEYDALAQGLNIPPRRLSPRSTRATLPRLLQTRKARIEAPESKPAGAQQIPREMVDPYGNQEWPVVEFGNGRMMVCLPCAFETENARGGVEATRFQVPLTLAWALSIHKSQGQTLERVRVDLGRVFATGQAYVALSRATSMKNLEVYNFSPDKVMAHPDVIRWMNEVTGRNYRDTLFMHDEEADRHISRSRGSRWSPKRN